MYVLSICQQLCPNLLPVKIGERLGDGADGEVFVVADEPNKVIKLSVIYDEYIKHSTCWKDFLKVQEVLDFVIANPSPVLAQVYEQGVFGEYSREVLYGNQKRLQKFVIYYYIMEKLYKLSEDERKVFHSILSHEDRGITKNYSLDKIREILQGLGRGLDFDAEKFILFCGNIRRSPVSHLDLHPRNIMKTVDGEF